jgi:putative radical SAM enzyme (TIGR03279 family)
VGLTRFRPTEDELTPVSREQAAEVIHQVHKLQEKFRHELKSTFAWLADEWFLIAGQDLPSESHYEDYPQIGNGVGSIRQFLKQFQEIASRNLPPKVETPRRFTWVVGNAVEKAFEPLVQQLNAVEGLEVRLAALRSNYWGQEITVTGLLTGQDLLRGLKGKDLGDAIVLPSLMLKHGDTRFLDDMTVEELARQLGIPILPVNGIEELIDACIQTTTGDQKLRLPEQNLPAPTKSFPTITLSS